LLGLPVLLIFLFVAGVDININFVILPIIIFIQFAFTLTLIYFFAALQINFRDTQHFLTTILQLGFFLTPIFYDISIVPEKYQDFYHLNPLVHILSSYRSLLLEGNFSGSLPLLFITILTIICFPFAYKRFQSARYRCLEEV
jgi:lipopolysaccharide transport system permease protein